MPSRKSSESSKENSLAWAASLAAFVAYFGLASNLIIRKSVEAFVHVLYRPRPLLIGVYCSRAILIGTRLID